MGQVFLSRVIAPDVDVKLRRRDRKQDFISLPSAPLFTLRISTQWLEAICEKASHHPKLGDRDRELLKEMRGDLERIREGAKNGAMAKAKLTARFGRNKTPLILDLRPASFERLAAILFRDSKES